MYGTLETVKCTRCGGICTAYQFCNWLATTSAPSERMDDSGKTRSFHIDSAGNRYYSGSRIATECVNHANWQYSERVATGIVNTPAPLRLEPMRTLAIVLVATNGLGNDAEPMRETYSVTHADGSVTWERSEQIGPDGFPSDTYPEPLRELRTHIDTMRSNGGDSHHSITYDVVEQMESPRMPARANVDSQVKAWAAYRPITEAGKRRRERMIAKETEAQDWLKANPEYLIPKAATVGGTTSERIPRERTRNGGTTYTGVRVPAEPASYGSRLPSHYTVPAMNGTKYQLSLDTAWSQSKCAPLTWEHKPIGIYGRDGSSAPIRDDNRVRGIHAYLECDHTQRFAMRMTRIDAKGKRRNTKLTDPQARAGVLLIQATNWQAITRLGFVDSESLGAAISQGWTHESEWLTAKGEKRKVGIRPEWLTNTVREATDPKQAPVMTNTAMAVPAATNVFVPS